MTGSSVGINASAPRSSALREPAAGRDHRPGRRRKESRRACSTTEPAAKAPSSWSALRG